MWEIIMLIFISQFPSYFFFLRNSSFIQSTIIPIAVPLSCNPTILWENTTTHAFNSIDLEEETKGSDQPTIQTKPNILYRTTLSEVYPVFEHFTTWLYQAPNSTFCYCCPILITPKAFIEIFRLLYVLHIIKKFHFILPISYESTVP